MNTTEKSQQLDLTATLVVGPAAALIALLVAGFRFAAAFTADGVRVAVPLTNARADTTLAGGEVVVGSPDVLTLTVPDLNPTSSIALGVSIALTAATWIAVSLLMVVLARELFAGRPFSRRATRAVVSASWITFAATCVIMLADRFAQNGALAAVAPEATLDTGYSSLLPYVLGWAFAFCLGLLGLAFTRGARLQKDTEGLI
ncbi:hypothetical protein [Microbacterium gorillae]|uniref:hypothetical protein n=1 Tax=Microbacterium gorillae TaxID=1231063 RepID=UPI00058EDC6D|nr:hypothetical protein [Microbacterium gorillae]